MLTCIKVSQPSASGVTKDIKPKRPSLLSQLDASFVPSPSSPPVQAKNASRSTFIKPEPSESVIPRKRPSDTGLTGSTGKAELHPFDMANPPSTPTSSKKLKAEAPKTPLAVINRNTGSSSEVQASVPGLSMTEATAQMDDVQQKLIRANIEFQKLARKKRKTKAEMMKFGRLSKDIDRLQARKNDYAAIVASLTPVPQPATHSLVPARDISHLPAPFPPVPHHPAFPSLEWKKPIINQLQPIASGSNVRLPDVPLPYRDVKMDPDDDDDDDDDGGDVGMSSDGPGLPKHVIAAMGPASAGLEGYGESFDDDGNFHGRGRDRFVGPQANPDEYVLF
jgi:hypothetical protein